MGTLNYAATVSLDGYAADRAGGIAWAAPDAEVFAFHLQRMREVTTEILGRRTYSMMQYWEDPPESEKLSSDETEFATRWKTLDKHVVSTTLAATQLGPDRTRLLRELCLADIRRIVTATSGVPLNAIQRCRPIRTLNSSNAPSTKSKNVCKPLAGYITGRQPNTTLSVRSFQQF